MIKLDAKQLRKYQGKSTKAKVKRNNVYIILDNVLDTYNIGSIFRLADAVAAKKVFLCGSTETPPNHKIKKASINTTEVVEWEYCESALDAVRKCKVQSAKCKIVAIEQSRNSVPYDQYDYKLPVALVVGHETSGVSREILDLCDAVVEIPMSGVNISLNVMVSLAIVLYKVIEKTHILV